MNYKASIYQPVNNQTEIAVKKIVDRILFSGRMSRQDYTLLTSAVLNHSDLSDEERRQINRIFDRIQTGQLQLVNW
ncbi:hypothetical protein [Calothrix sp. PCC 7507]|uniref:hypothetical protein n=1 Tax=Calothrix sp. PCC 7507 TaxID=99598 RepID=UPI00029EDCAC|nr:hypothetical protein [Calothrix sp. PCC 7507]AFY34103.1 hypothetical protein Cal7507_3712 [Calothrix sp. PCC 7507]